jgi:hypothetical protein
MRRLFTAALFVAACEWAYAAGSVAGAVACGFLAPIVLGLILRPELVPLIAASILDQRLLDQVEAVDAPALFIDCRGVTPTHADIVEVIEGWRSLSPEIRARILELVRPAHPKGDAGSGAEIMDQDVREPRTRT